MKFTHGCCAVVLLVAPLFAAQSNSNAAKYPVPSEYGRSGLRYYVWQVQDDLDAHDGHFKVGIDENDDDTSLRDPTGVRADHSGEWGLRVIRNATRSCAMTCLRDEAGYVGLIVRDPFEVWYWVLGAIAGALLIGWWRFRRRSNANARASAGDSTR